MKLSIITPVYNRAECLSRCIESVIRQDYSDWEMIIVDDGSTDNSLSVARQYQSNDGRVRVYGFQHNKGTNAARNFAVQHSEGDYILILDSDDWLDEKALVNVSNTIINNPDFQHYVFQADDLLDYYHSNELLNKGENVVLCYKDWLSQKVTGDFIHVIARSIMYEFPFDERTRIMEGVNFLRFYRAEQRQLYVPQVITHRERGRVDSVTLTTLLFTKNAIERSLLANRNWLNYFSEDCESMNLTDILSKKRRLVKLLSLAMCDYEQYDEVVAADINPEKFLMKIIRKLHMGKVVRLTVVMFSYLKNLRNR